MDGKRENIYSQIKKVPSSSRILKQRTFNAKAQELKSAAAKTGRDKDEEGLDGALKAGERIRSMGERIGGTSRLSHNPYAAESIKGDEPDRAAQRKIEELGSDLSLD